MKLELARMGHPVLLTRAKEVADVFAPDVQQFIQALQVMHAAADEAVLAAPQVFIPLRIFIMDMSLCEPRVAEQLPCTVFVNPEVEASDDERVIAREHCCSVPGMVGNVERARTIRYRALSAQGEILHGELSDTASRLFQHGLDHLNGILYTMRLTDFRQFGFAYEMAKRDE